MKLLSVKEKAIGKSRERRRYDLPLNKDGGTSFLLLLIALMSFLTVIALTASFALSTMSNRWSSGLENKITIEVPAVDIQGNTLSRSEIKRLTSKIKTSILDHPAVEDIHVLSDEEITDLVEPWLGSDLLAQDFPVPGLLSLTVSVANESTIRILEDRAKSISPNARFDTHQSWLKDLFRVTHALQFGAFIMVLLIAGTMVTAIAGAIRSRMEIHKAEVELLHLMGATDHYIANQFKRHSFMLAIKGSAMGLVGGCLALATIGWIAGEAEISLLPEFTLSTQLILALLLLPFFIGVLAAMTAGRTVGKVLAAMP